MMHPGTMHQTEDVGTGEDLARFLDPTGDPWTKSLLQLAAAAAADPARLARLRQAFPAEVVTWEVWSALEDIPSAGQLRALVALVWWPGRNGIPTAETIAFMIADYRAGRVTLAAVES